MPKENQVDADKQDINPQETLQPEELVQIEQEINATPTQDVSVGLPEPFGQCRNVKKTISFSNDRRLQRGDDRLELSNRFGKLGGQLGARTSDGNMSKHDKAHSMRRALGIAF